MKHFKVKKFTVDAKKARIPDSLLHRTLNNFLALDEKGQQRYALGAGLYKLRVATKEGQGKRSGSRSILAFKKSDRVIWLHIFSKNDKENITSMELKRLKILSEIMLNLSPTEINKLLKDTEIYEVK